MGILQKLEERILGRPSFRGAGNRLGTADEERAQQEAKRKEAEAAAAAAHGRAGAGGGAGPSGGGGGGGRPSSAAAAAAAARMSSAASRGKSSAGPRREGADSSQGGGVRGKDKIAELYPGLDVQRLRRAARDEVQKWDETARQALAKVKGAADDSAGGAAIEMVVKILSNVVNANEGNFHKVRKLRRNNPKLDAVLFSRSGSQELLELIGFELTHASDGETYLVLPEDNNLQKVKRALQLIGSDMGHAVNFEESARQNTGASNENVVDRNRAADDGRAAVDHSFGGADDVRVFTIPQGSLMSQIEMPESFYDRSAQEVKDEYAKIHQNNENSKILMTKSQREALKGATHKSYSKCVVRIRFPHGRILQGTFRPSDKVELIHEFLNLAITPPGSTYSLHPPLSSGDLSKSFQECHLCPAAIFHFKFDELSDSSCSDPGLTEELLAIAEDL